MATSCSPNSVDKISCFNNDALINIANNYNKKYPKNKITIPNKLDGTNREIFWKELNNKINKVTECETENCWLKLDFIDSKLHKNFKPKYPDEWLKNKNAWLSTYDINNVLEQYEKNNNYKYIGAVPIDFDKKLSIGLCVVNELCNINIKSLYLAGIRYLGAVFNLDPHDQPGSHWVSLFINLFNGGIYYFDSYGNKPPQEVNNLMEKVRLMANDLLRKNIISMDYFSDEHAIKTNFEIISDYEIKINTDRHINNNLPIFIDNELIHIENIIPISSGQVLKLKEKIEKKEGKLIQYAFHKFFNNIRFQYEGSECGVYSIYFQIELLKGNPFTEIISNIIDDSTINKQRDIYYRS